MFLFQCGHLSTLAEFYGNVKIKNLSPLSAGSFCTFLMQPAHVENGQDLWGAASGAEEIIGMHNVAPKMECNVILKKNFLFSLKRTFLFGRKIAVFARRLSL